MVKVVVLDVETHRRLKGWAAGLGMTSGALVKRLVFQSEVPAMMRDTSGEVAEVLSTRVAEVLAVLAVAGPDPMAAVRAKAYVGAFSKASQVGKKS